MGEKPNLGERARPAPMGPPHRGAAQASANGVQSATGLACRSTSPDSIFLDTGGGGALHFFPIKALLLVGKSIVIKGGIDDGN